MNSRELLPTAYGIAGFNSVVTGEPISDALTRHETLTDFTRRQAKARRAALVRQPIDRSVAKELRENLAEREREIAELREALLKSARESIRTAERIRVLEMKERALARAEAFELAFDGALNRGELSNKTKVDLSTRLAEHAARTRMQNMKP